MMAETAMHEGRRKMAKGKEHSQGQRAMPSYAQSLVPLHEKAFFNTVQQASVKAVVDTGISCVLSNGKEAIVPVSDFAGKVPELGASITLYVGDPVQEAQPLHASFSMAQALVEAERVEQAFSANEEVYGYVVGVIKGGYSVALLVDSREQVDSGQGLRAFLPGHDATLHRGEKLKLYGMNIVPFKVKEFDPTSGNLVVSRRDMLLKERAENAKKLWETLAVGQEVQGVVRSLVSYGAFVDLGGVDALLHVADISWDHVPQAGSVLRQGQWLNAKVIELDKAAKKIKIGLKQLTEDPFISLEKGLKPGSEVKGTVVALTDFGAFLHLAEGVEGLIHVSEIAWQRVKHPSQRFKIGDEVTARVLGLDKDTRRVSLSTKALERSPVDKLADKFPVGAVLKTHVAKVLDFGALVDLGEGVLGLVHASELSWTKRFDEPKDIVTEGQEVEVVVLGYDSERQRVSCSMKQVAANPWIKWSKTYTKGSKHKAVVKKYTSHGAELELEADLLAYCPLKDLAEEVSGRPQDTVKLGQELEVMVTICDPKAHKIQVSVRALSESETREAYANYLDKQAQEGNTKMTLGDVIKAHQENENV